LKFNHNTMKNLKILLFVLMALPTSLSVHAKKVQLIYKLGTGTEFSIILTQNQEITQEVMEQRQVITNEMVTKYMFKVLEKTREGNYIIEEKTGAIKLKMETDGMAIDIDTENDEELPEEMKIITAGLNVPVKLILSPQGKIIDIIDAEEYISKTEALFGDDNPMTQMMAGIGAQFVGIEGVKNAVTGLFFNYPEGKITVGESWNDETESTQMIQFRNLIENTVVEADRETAVIKQVQDIEQKDIGGGMEMQGMKIKYELSGRKEGEYRVNRKTGLIENSGGVTNIAGIISIESPQLPTPMSIPMNLKITEKVEIVK